MDLLGCCRRIDVDVLRLYPAADYDLEIGRDARGRVPLQLGHVAGDPQGISGAGALADLQGALGRTPGVSGPLHGRITVGITGPVGGLQGFIEIQIGFGDSEGIDADVIPVGIPGRLMLHAGAHRDA